MPKIRVIVAMSGGVDSSVAAAFLKEKGYDVVGITMRFWGEENRCCNPKDLDDARKVASHLSIPHYTVSFHDLFKKNIVDYFVSEYIIGRTPNPCAVCNPTIKFGALLNKARELGANLLATGHYAMVSKNNKTERFVLRRAREAGKDQSYFLARLSQNALKHTLFPIGSFPKSKIRTLASRMGLPVAGKKESQEVCFIPDGNVAGFIENEQGKAFETGPIVHENGEVLGEHPGIIGYTIGQRKGLGIAVGSPLFVTRINAKTNTIVVGDGESLYQQEFTAADPLWSALEKLEKPIKVQARIRYAHKPQPALLTPLPDGRVHTAFEKSQRAITPGQLVVFYNKDIVLGSAWIEKVFSNLINS